jgi:aspartate/methionine/tyrosine aminotransferase
MIEHDDARRERYRNARNYFTVTANVFGEHLAAFAIEQSGLIYERARRVSRDNLALLDGIFGENADLFQWVRPQGGMTAFPLLRGCADTRDFCRRLAGRGVLMAPGDCFGQPQHFRLGFAASGEKFRLAIDRFREFVESDLRQRSVTAAP